MRRFALLCLFMGFAPLCFSNESSSLPKVPKGMTFILQSGKTIEYQKYLGKPVLLVFWATWCEPCLMEIPSMVNLQKKYKGKGLQIISVVLDGEEQKEALKDIIKSQDVNYPVYLMHPDLEKTFGEIGTLPTAFLIHKDGSTAEKLQGYRSEVEIEKKILGLF